MTSQALLREIRQNAAATLPIRTAAATFGGVLVAAVISGLVVHAGAARDPVSFQEVMNTYGLGSVIATAFFSNALGLTLRARETVATVDALERFEAGGDARRLMFPRRGTDGSAVRFPTARHLDVVADRLERAGKKSTRDPSIAAVVNQLEKVSESLRAGKMQFTESDWLFLVRRLVSF